MQLIKKGEGMIFSTVEMNDSIYLKVPIKIEKINKNKFEMLQYNEIKGIINFNRQYFNETCFLNYNLDTYVSLRSLEKQNGLPDYQLVEILSQVNEIIFSLEDYFLLDSKDIILDIENIYFDYYRKDVHMIYIPVDHMESLNSNYKRFISSLLEGMTIEKKHSSLMNALNVLITRDEFSVKALDELIKNEIVNKIQEKVYKKPLEENKIFEKRNSLADTVEKESLEVSKNSKHELFTNIIRGIAIEGIAILLMNLFIQYFNLSDKVNQLKIIVLLQMIFIVVIYLVAIKDYYSINQIKEYLKSKSDYNRKKSSRENIFTPTNTESEKANENQISYNTSTVIEGVYQGNYDTKAFLLKKNFNSEEKIYITEKNFILGREAEGTDYHINDSKVSKRHLEILDIDDELFIRDLNSTNGTYLNEVKIDANRLTKIFNGDIIKMASLVYEFKIE